MGGLALLRLGQLLLREGRAGREADDAGEGGFWRRVVRLLGRVVMAAGAVAPVLVALGYVNFGIGLLWPTVLTLGLIGLVGVTQSFVFDLYSALTRRTEAPRDALLPTLVGFALAVAALPLFALIWGVLRRWPSGGTRSCTASRSARPPCRRAAS